MGSKRELKIFFVDDFEYKIKHIGAVSSFTAQVRLLKLLTPIFQASSIVSQKKILIKAMKGFFSESLKLDEKKMKAMIGPEDFKKVKDLLKGSYSPIKLAELLKEKIEHPELVYKILKEGTEGIDGDLEKSFLESLPDITEVIHESIHSFDEDKLTILMEDLINLSMVKVRIDKKEDWQDWGEGEDKINFTKLNSYLGWDELLEIVVIVCLYNFLTPIKKLVKKKLLIGWWKEIMGGEEITQAA